MFRILQTHVSVDVPDLTEAKKYLQEICGLEKIRELKKTDKTITWYPGVELSQVEDGEKPGIVKHIAWQVDDIRQAMRVLKEKGVCFDTEEPAEVDPALLDTKEVVRYVFFHTPIGFRGELYQVAPPKNDLMKG